MTRVFQITSETVISQSRRDYRFIAGISQINVRPHPGSQRMRCPIFTTNMGFLRNSLLIRLLQSRRDYRFIANISQLNVGPHPGSQRMRCPIFTTNMGFLRNPLLIRLLQSRRDCRFIAYISQPDVRLRRGRRRCDVMILLQTWDSGGILNRSDYYNPE